MCELSAADGFVEINENLGDMIKYVANEPSVGLYYIQQHVQNAVPNVVRVKTNIMHHSHEMSLHTEDVVDSIAMTRTMKECGFPIIDEMIRDIKKSLIVMSSKKPIRGVIQQGNSSYLMGGSSSWGSVTWARSAVSLPDEVERSGGYFSSALKSAKERAGNLKWPQLDLREVKENLGGGFSIYADLQVVHPGSSSSTQVDETDELPLSSQVENEMVEDSNASVDGKTPAESDFDEFKAEREARLEEWLKGSGNVSQKGVAENHHDRL